MAETTCDYCGETISKPPRKLKMNDKHFCNREHAQRFYNDGNTRADNLNLIVAIVDYEGGCYTPDILEYVSFNRSKYHSYRRELLKEGVLQKKEKHRGTSHLYYVDNYKSCRGGE